MAPAFACSTPITASAKRWPLAIAKVFRWGLRLIGCDPSPSARSDSLRVRHSLPQGERESEFASRPCFTDAIVKRPSQRSAASFFDRPEVGRLPSSLRRSRKYRGRAGRRGLNRTHGPRRLTTSRLVEVLLSVFALATSADNPQVRQTQGVPRGVLVCSASVPGGRPFQASAFGEGTSRRSRTKRLEALTNLRATVAGGPRDRGSRRSPRLGPPGPCSASPPQVIPRPPLPASCLKMLIRHPSVTRRDTWNIIVIKAAVKPCRRRPTHYRADNPSAVISALRNWGNCINLILRRGTAGDAQACGRIV